MAEAKVKGLYYAPGGLGRSARSLAREAKVTQREAREILGKQEVFQIVRPPRLDRAAAPRISVPPPWKGRDIMHQADLLFLPNDRGYKYALVVVDGHSRKLDAEPLKGKSAEAVRDGLQRIYRRGILRGPPYKVEVDPGAEFKGATTRYLFDKKAVIRRGDPGRHRSQALVEAANRRIGVSLLRRQIAQELLTGEPSREWAADLPALVQRLNSERRPPAPVKPSGPKLPRSRTVLPEGTKVRVALEEPRDVATGKRLPGPFRAADARFSTEIHTIECVVLSPGQPPLYFVDGYKQSFTADRLRPVAAVEAPPPSVIRGKPERYVVEDLLERRRRGNRVEYLVKWYGYPRGEATWEARSTLLEDVPAMVRAFEA